jgi:hypothetical protein
VLRRPSSHLEVPSRTKHWRRRSFCWGRGPVQQLSPCAPLRHAPLLPP